MARIDYLGIENAIANTLRDNLFEAHVEVEKELIPALEMSPWIGVYLERRAQSANQYLSAGRRVDYDLQITIWCWCFGLEVEAVVKARDALIARVEDIILGNRHFGLDPDVIETTILDGGEMPTGRVPETNGFGSGAEILLVVKVHATTEG